MDEKNDINKNDDDNHTTDTIETEDTEKINTMPILKYHRLNSGFHDNDNDSKQQAEKNDSDDNNQQQKNEKLKSIVGNEIIFDGHLTCIAMHAEYIVAGTSTGFLYIFTLNGEKLVS